MTHATDDIATLNSLIATTIDSANGYDESATAVDSGRFAEQFRTRAGERRRIAEELRVEVRRLGGNPEDDGTLLAAGHRAFLDLKAAVTGRDDQAVINEVERGEDYLKAKYEAALAESNLHADTRAAIERAYGSVKAGHDEARDLKLALNN